MTKYPGSDAVRTQVGGIVFRQPPVCIYCDAAPGTSDEHIIPKALHGEAVFRNAVCESCRKKTGAYEIFVLHQMLGLHRRALSFPSQNKKAKRKKIPATIIATNPDGSEEKLDLNTYPNHYVGLPLFDYPGMTAQIPLATLYAGEKLHVIAGKHDAEAALAAAGGHRPVRMPPIKYDRLRFTRFLAKVAHAFAVAVLGRDAFKPFLRDFIRSGTGDPRMFVGGEPEIEPYSNEIFSIGLGSITRVDGRLLLAVRIQFLGYLQMPTYCVIVGDGFQGNFADVQNGAYARPIEIKLVDPSGRELENA